MATTIPNRTALIVSPHLYLADVTGRPLEYGRVYFGESNKDGEFYPINIFSDKELTEPLAQPVYTKGGFLHNNGDITEVFAYEGVYSVKVLDQYGRKIFYKGEVAKQTIEDATSDVVDAAQVEINRRMFLLDSAIATAAAAGVGASGWTDLLVNNADDKPLRHTSVEQVESIADLNKIAKISGRTIVVKSYHAGLNKGGGTFVYDTTKAAINDGGVVINGWVRQLDSNEIDPVCFGAKAEFTRDKMNTTFDDAPAVQKTVNYLSSVRGGTVIFKNGNYWINSYQRAETSDPINVIDMKSDVSFKWEKGSQFIIGNYFDDKPFHIFSGLIKDAPVMRNIHFINPYITSIIESNYLKTRYTRRVIAEFRQCENVSVTGGIIRDVETTNVLGFGSEGKISFGATVENMKFLNVVYGGLESANEDHTTIYLNAQDSKVTNCTFSNLNGEKGWRTACPCELHASNTTFSNSKVSGYTRGGWFVADSHDYTTNQCIENITAVIASAGIYIWCNQGKTLDTCVARNNTFICYHPIDTDIPLYYGWQGLFCGSGQDTGGLVQNVVFENNTVIYKHATSPQYQVAFSRHYQNHINFTIRDNKFIGCSAGIRGAAENKILDNYKNWDITNNVFEVDTLADSAKDAYLLFDSKADLSQFRLDNNVFKFKTAAPKYICKLTAEVSSSNYLGNCIVIFNAPTIADYTYPNNVAGDFHNIIHNTFYGLIFNVPAIGVGKYAVVQPTVQPTIAIPYRSTASFIAAWPSEVSVESDVRVTSGNIKAIIKNATLDNTQSPQREIGGVICKVVGYA